MSRILQEGGISTSPPSLSRRSTAQDSITNGETPSHAKKGVQFSDDDEQIHESPVSPANASNDHAEPKPHSLYAKLRSIATSQGFTHTRSSSGWSARSADGKENEGLPSAGSSRPEPGVFATLEEGEGEEDADAEESAADTGLDQITPRKRRRKAKRADNVVTAPSSPHSPIQGIYQSAPVGANANRPPTLARRATDTDTSRERTGISEDEGRRRLQPTSAWTPKHPLRGLSYGASERRSGEDSAEGREGRRPHHLRNLTTITSQSSREPNEAETPRASRRRQILERGTTQSAQKWRQLKQKIQMMGQGRKRERTQDQLKSAELLAELQAGGPAALIIASMFQRDEHGQRRIPILLEQLKISITDSEIDNYKDKDVPTPGDRHMIFRIELEYGNGINRMKWVIKRSLRDFATMHFKYKLHYSSEQFKGRGDSIKEMPNFPKSAFPYFKSLGYFKDEEDDDDDDAGNDDGAATDNDRPKMKNRGFSALGRRKSSVGDANNAMSAGPGGNREQAIQMRQRERQRKKLEVYLQKMLKFMLFRADGNRLCKFLEVSALGMRLAAEGSYHGKEGFLLIQSAKGLDFRKTLTPKNVKYRHSPKWFLVRHSYVVCVDSPEEMNIYDVFLFDSDFRIQSSKLRSTPQSAKEKHHKPIELLEAAKDTTRHPRHHRLKLYNSERRLKLLARNERLLHQFEESIQQTMAQSPWTKVNRFESFAPVRQKCFAQWLVDGRDHMWVVSRALQQAKDVIYIHDWWLSPELYMRRPAAISQKWRLDRVLKQKAEEGVKIFIIVYRNIESAVPIDSQYTKFSLLDLHPNIFVQRSPNQFRQNTFFWAHHEKLCLIDHTLAFVGGIDLCFGRWDTPQHTLVDDKPTGFEPGEDPRDADHCQLWPGKDYSNPRVQDFYELNKPYEEMYDRQKVARMPWHDISMQVVGQPARDLARHFVQRWNYILRQRKPTRPTPFLLPPPDFNPGDMEALGLDGTCEVQMLRSAGPWSLGTPEKTEHSIMNAYIKMVEESEHFIYIENQFFISSCETEGAVVHNKLGDALVERITRACKNDEAWRCVIVIPLIPGFQNTVEQEGGTSVRLIMQYQYRSICRGESSIFGRLRSNGIDPEDYIQFYSLRQWGRVGANRALVTEQLYIHAKCMVVDDRIAIIGSANINERSMLGNRDSECAAVVRDTDMLQSRMNGEPYRVGRFAHTLRMRLMREHLGLDVDKIMEDAQAMENETRKANDGNLDTDDQAASAEQDDYFASTADDKGPVLTPHTRRRKEISEDLLDRQEVLHSFNHDVDWEQANNPNLKANRKLTEDHRVTGTAYHKDDIEGRGYDHMNDIAAEGFGDVRDTTLVRNDKEVLTKTFDTEGRATLTSPRKNDEEQRVTSYVAERKIHNPPMPPRPTVTRGLTTELGMPMVSTLPPLPVVDDTDIGGPPLEETRSRESGPRRHPLMDTIHKPFLDRDCMLDPIHDAFIYDTWHAIAENNTKIYRTVFRCMPDSLVRDWNEYHQYLRYEQRFDQLQGHDSAENKVKETPERPTSAKQSGPPGAGSAQIGVAQLKALSKVPTDVAKAGKDMQEKIFQTLGVNDANEKHEQEKEKLRAWAAEANQAQADRWGKPLHRSDSMPVQSGAPADPEKAALATVPEDHEHEHSRLPTPSDHGTDGTATVNGSRPTTGTVAAQDFASEKDAPSSPKVNYSAALNRNRSNSNSDSIEVPMQPQPITPVVEAKDPEKRRDHSSSVSGSIAGTAGASNSTRRRRRGTTRSSRRDFSASDDILSVEEAEELLGMVQGHLVLWPYDW